MGRRDKAQEKPNDNVTEDLTPDEREQREKEAAEAEAARELANNPPPKKPAAVKKPKSTESASTSEADPIDAALAEATQEDIDASMEAEKVAGLKAARAFLEMHGQAALDVGNGTIGHQFKSAIGVIKHLEKVTAGRKYWRKADV